MKSGQPYEWASFTDDDYWNMALDVEASRQFLDSRGYTGSFSLVGASIGANVAIQYAAQEHALKGIVLLSPGTDYHTVTLERYLPSLSQIKIYVAAGREDQQTTAAVGEIQAALGEKAYVIWYGGSDHGTQLLTAHPELEGLIVEWISDAASAQNTTGSR